MDQLCLSPNPSPSPNPKPNHEPADPNLRPVNSTAFKREARKKRKERKRVQKLEDKLDNLLALGTHTRPSNPVSFSNIEWPCDEITSDPIPETGWVVPDPNPLPAPPPSAEEKFKAASLRVQQKVLKKCQGFFSSNDESDEEDDEEEDVGNSRAFEFFEGLFEKNGDLRGVYEKNWEKGEFCCLVCAAVGEKVGKRYVNCVGLVQHANTVTKTKRRGAHRDFGRVVCGVLGWDIDKLPGVLEGKSSVRDGSVQVKVTLDFMLLLCSSYFAY